MKNFYIIITVAVFTAISWSPEPCNVPQSFTYEVKTDTAFADPCRACAIQVQQAASQQLYQLQLDSLGARVITEVRIDSTEQE